MKHIKVILAYLGSEGVITDTKTMHGGTFESAGWMGFVNKKRCRQRETTPERGRRWISLKTRFHCWAAQLFASGDDHWARRSARLRRDVGPRAPVHHLPRLVRVPVSPPLQRTHQHPPKRPHCENDEVSNAADRAFASRKYPEFIAF